MSATVSTSSRVTLIVGRSLHEAACFLGCGTTSARLLPAYSDVRLRMSPATIRSWISKGTCSQCAPGSGSCLSVAPN
jgi:hypothetical protein